MEGQETCLLTERLLFCKFSSTYRDHFHTRGFFPQRTMEASWSFGRACISSTVETAADQDPYTAVQSARPPNPHGASPQELFPGVQFCGLFRLRLA